MFASQVPSRALTLARRAAPALAAALVFAALTAAPALAQDAAPAAPEDNSMSIGALIVQSGFIGWMIIALSIVTLAVVIEAYVTLSRDKLAPPALIDEIQSLFDEGQYQEAMELCENEPTFFTRVVAAGISKIGHSFDVIQTSIQEMGDEEAIRLHQKIGWISVLAAVSPMLGLFGTVTTIIDRGRADLRVVDAGTRSFDLAREMPRRVETPVRAHPEVARVEPVVLGMGDWRTPEGGRVSVTLAGFDTSAAGLAFPADLPPALRQALPAPGAVLADDVDLGKSRPATIRGVEALLRPPAGAPPGRPCDQVTFLPILISQPTYQLSKHDSPPPCAADTRSEYGGSPQL